MQQTATGRAKTLVGRLHPDEYPTRLTRRTNFTEVASQRRTNVHGQRQSLQSLALAPHDKLPTLPVQIIQSHGHDLAAAQSEPGQQQQDRVVALAGR